MLNALCSSCIYLRLSYRLHLAARLRSLAAPFFAAFKEDKNAFSASTINTTQTHQNNTITTKQHASTSNKGRHRSRNKGRRSNNINITNNLKQHQQHHQTTWNNNTKCSVDAGTKTSSSPSPTFGRASTIIITVKRAGCWCCWCLECVVDVLSGAGVATWWCDVRVFGILFVVLLIKIC